MRLWDARSHRPWGGGSVRTCIWRSRETWQQRHKIAEFENEFFSLFIANGRGQCFGIRNAMLRQVAYVVEDVFQRQQVFITPRVSAWDRTQTLQLVNELIHDAATERLLHVQGNARVRGEVWRGRRDLFISLRDCNSLLRGCRHSSSWWFRVGQCEVTWVRVVGVVQSAARRGSSATLLVRAMCRLLSVLQRPCVGQGDGTQAWGGPSPP
jgi:hypothetical protein